MHLDSVLASKGKRRNCCSRFRTQLSKRKPYNAAVFPRPKPFQLMDGSLRNALTHCSRLSLKLCNASWKPPIPLLSKLLKVSLMFINFFFLKNKKYPSSSKDYRRQLILKLKLFPPNLYLELEAR